MNKLKELFQYRAMLFRTIQRDLDAAYRRSLLGSVWIFLNPLLQLWVYNIVFAEILEINQENYFIFLASALIPWIFFSATVSGGAKCVFNSQDMLKKIYYPREIMPISYTTTQFITMALSLAAVLVVELALRVHIEFSAWLFLPLIMLIEYLFALGMIFVTSAITVYFRDMEFILSIGIMAWQFLTPVMYPSDFVPEELLPIWRLNPVTPIIEAYREIIYYQRAPQMSNLGLSLLVSVVCLLVGGAIFEKMQKNFAEEF